MRIAAGARAALALSLSLAVLAGGCGEAPGGPVAADDPGRHAGSGPEAALEADLLAMEAAGDHVRVLCEVSNPATAGEPVDGWLVIGLPEGGLWPRDWGTAVSVAPGTSRLYAAFATILDDAGDLEPRLAEEPPPPSVTVSVRAPGTSDAWSAESPTGRPAAEISSVAVANRPEEGRVAATLTLGNAADLLAAGARDLDVYLVARDASAGEIAFFTDLRVRLVAGQDTYVLYPGGEKWLPEPLAAAGLVLEAYAY